MKLFDIVLDPFVLNNVRFIGKRFGNLRAKTVVLSFLINHDWRWTIEIDN